MGLTLLISVVLFSLSAFLAWSEIALFSLSWEEVLGFEEKEGTKGIRYLLTNFHTSVSAIVIGNVGMNLVATTLAAVVIHRYVQRMGMHHEMEVALDAVLVVAVLLFVEVFPKALASRFGRQMLKNGIVRKSVVTLVLLFYPLAVFFSDVGVAIAKRFVASAGGLKTVRTDDPKDVLDYLIEKNVLTGDVKRIFKNVIQFSTLAVGEVMVPRNRATFISAEVPIRKFLEEFRVHRHSRVPVYKESIDNVIGILYAKDVLLALSRLLLAVNENGEDAREELRRALEEPVEKFLPEKRRKVLKLEESHQLSRAYAKMLQTRTHMAIVVDEYMGVSGIITLEDILEELVGEIKDEYDELEKEEKVEKVGENQYRVPANYPVDKLNYEYDLDLPSPAPYKTVLGLVLHETHEIEPWGMSVEVRGERGGKYSLQPHKDGFVILTVLEEPEGE